MAKSLTLRISLGKLDFPFQIITRIALGMFHFVSKRQVRCVNLVPYFQEDRSACSILMKSFAPSNVVLVHIHFFRPWKKPPVAFIGSWTGVVVVRIVNKGVQGFQETLQTPLLHVIILCPP